MRPSFLVYSCVFAVAAWGAFVFVTDRQPGVSGELFRDGENPVAGGHTSFGRGLDDSQTLAPLGPSASREARGDVIIASTPDFASEEATIRARLEDPDPEVRMSAIRDAIGLDPENGTPILQDVLLKEKDGAVAAEAERILSLISGEDAVAVVTTALSDPDVAVRRASLEALGRVGPSAMHLLGQVLYGDPERELRLRVVALLARNGGPAAMALLETAADDPDPAVRQAVLDAIAVLEQTSMEMAQSGAAPGAAPAMSGLQDPPGRTGGGVRSESTDDGIDALYRLVGHDEGAIQRLEAVLITDSDVRVRTEALYLLESIGGDRAMTAMETALGEDTDVEIRHQAMEALWTSGRSRAIPALGRVLYDEVSPEIRLEAVLLLAEDAGPAARALLAVARLDPDDRVRAAAGRLLD